MKKCFTQSFILLIAIQFSVVAFGQQDISGTIMHDGLERTYYLHLPTNYVEGTPLPLVFNLHGFSSNALEQGLYSNMNPTADANDFLVCYPEGTSDGNNQFWNVGWNPTVTVDDVGFINALIDEFDANYSIDLTRVYSCGMSNGGFMSYKLACDLGERFAAVASVTGGMSHNQSNTCNPVRKIPTMQIHGTADPTVAYEGR